MCLPLFIHYLPKFRPQPDPPYATVESLQRSLLHSHSAESSAGRTATNTDISESGSTTTTNTEEYVSCGTDPLTGARRSTPTGIATSGTQHQQHQQRSVGASSATTTAATTTSTSSSHFPPGSRAPNCTYTHSSIRTKSCVCLLCVCLCLCIFVVVCQVV